MEHEVVNRWLVSVALVLGIVLMLAVLYEGARVQSALSSFGSGSSVSGTQPTGAPDGDCYDPGGGVVCDGGNP